MTAPVSIEHRRAGCEHAYLHGSCPFCEIDRLRQENLRLRAIAIALQRAHDLAVGERRQALRSMATTNRFNRAARRRLAELTR